MPEPTSHPRVVIVVPAYNEVDNIAAVLGAASRIAPVVLVDDGSTDGTRDAVANLPGVHCIRQPVNRHIAASLRLGLHYALEQRFDRIVTMDAGGSHDPAAIPSMTAAGVDVAIGARRRRVAVPWYRETLSAAARVAVNVLLRLGPGTAGPVSDATSGFRCYSAPAVAALLAGPALSRSFDFHFDALVRLHWRGFSIAEVPIEYRFTGSSLNRTVMADGLRTYFRLLRELAAGPFET